MISLGVGLWDVLLAGIRFRDTLLKLNGPFGIPYLSARPATIRTLGFGGIGFVIGFMATYAKLTTSSSRVSCAFSAGGAGNAELTKVQGLSRALVVLRVWCTAI